VLGLIEREVMDLAARLIGGGKRREASTPEIHTEAVDPIAKNEVVRKSAPWSGWGGKRKAEGAKA